MSDVAQDEAEFAARLKAYEGRPAAVAGVGKDRVNEAMIRHWCEAMGDRNPAYTGPDAIAPPTMLQVWTMGGLSGHEGRTEAYGELLALLDEAGCGSVVATDCEQEYLRPLRPGDEITFDAVIESVSERKRTKLGTGYFVTTRMDVRVGGEPVGTHRFRILKYAPATSARAVSAPEASVSAASVPAVSEPAASVSAVSAPVTSAAAAVSVPATSVLAGSAPAGSAPAGSAPVTSARTKSARTKSASAASASASARQESRGRRPRPVINRDNAGFWEGVGRHRLLIQRCAACRTLRFPWLPGCNACGGAEWDTVEASGEGTVYSYVVMHHPPFPAFDPPYAVGLFELAEGVRIVSNVVGVPHDKVRIGMPVRLAFVRYDEEMELPVFRPAEALETPSSGPGDGDGRRGGGR
ncbi:OB-fold domain-containing protein [Streptomyces sp. NPDC007264]|uniref:bifunctional MaoC family dehydratase N-terminal/OB-fold nucleic acid binding domain-containing protein n=1 Tax=Streptomyces sp. NPDC007264 TaxID=3364777 RepID=UPI0036DA33CE